MNNEIKDNDYVRTDDGIKQIIKINTGNDKVYKKYKDYEVLSIKDYDDTKTTSVIIKRRNKCLK